MTEDQNKAELIKKALTIVDKLADIEIDEIKDGDIDYDNLDDLIVQAEKLKKDRLWKLK